MNHEKDVDELLFQWLLRRLQQQNVETGDMAYVLINHQAKPRLVRIAASPATIKSLLKYAPDSFAYQGVLVDVPKSEQPNEVVEVSSRQIRKVFDHPPRLITIVDTATLN